MSRSELLVRLQEIVEKLEQRQMLIERWLVQEDPELVAHGQSQKIVVDEYHVLLKDLLIELQTTG